MSIDIGSIAIRNTVFLAPMSGVSDEPFRALAHELGAGLVVSEMVASEELVRLRPDMVKRTAGRRKIEPLVVQLAGREARWMAEGARIAQDLGADIIDINMGCPARQVTGGLSGSALMRDVDHATGLIEATVAAARVPVTLKMRLGWDTGQLNAPELAQRAESVGASLVTVHGRTRCQFYKDKADWTAIRRVKEAVGIPVIANGDVGNVEQARHMLAQSGADGIMMGRGAYGKPWAPGMVAQQLEPGRGRACPSIAEQGEIVQRHYEAILSHYGIGDGVRVARKHLGWYVAGLAKSGHLSLRDALFWRSELVGASDPKKVRAGIAVLYEAAAEGMRSAA
jgi:nifR3 family TIM-barrel protein